MTETYPAAHNQQPRSQSGWNVIVVILLVVAGMFAQYRYSLVERVILRNSSKLGSALSLGAERARVQNADAPANHSDVNFGIFWEVWDVLENNYVDQTKLDATKMVDGAVAGMTSSLGDPYTSYLPPKDFERTGEDLAGAFYGVGIELGYKNGILAAVAPLADSPAEKGGVKAGDLIIRVKDTAKSLDADSSQWSLSEAVDNIRGPKGSQVTLTLAREEAKEPIEVTLTRDEIVVKSVELTYVEQGSKKVAHVKLSRFGERTMAEWDGVVKDIVSQKNSLSGIVLDMRNNPGGLFDDAIAVASDFIPEGVIVSQQGRTTKQDFTSRGTGRLANMPLVVLVNKGSASASEIVAGALRDRLSAKIVGEKTFGKGTVQDRRDLSNGGGVHVTIAKWLLPGGSWIHETGIPTDPEIKDNPETEEDEQLQKAIEVLQ